MTSKAQRWAATRQAGEVRARCMGFAVVPYVITNARHHQRAAQHHHPLPPLPCWPNAGAVLKDQNFNSSRLPTVGRQGSPFPPTSNKLHISNNISQPEKDTRQHFLAQLASDCKWLRDHNLVDYRCALVVGVVPRAECGLLENPYPHAASLKPTHLPHVSFG